VKDIKEKLAIVGFCMVFAIPFGGVGVFASWMIGKMLHDGYAAREWVKVRAVVDTPQEYHYTFQGRDYFSRRLGLEPLGGSDNIDDWHAVMSDHMTTAMNEKKPITVFVNPDNPGEAVVDREIRWKLLLLFTPFALAFGGVGVGAVGFALRTVFPSLQVRSSAVAGVLIHWVFAFFWNALSFPIAILAVPPAIEEGEYLVLLVLLFPLFGVLMLWSAIMGTVGLLRRRKPALPLDDTARVS
jgi:hypothetical protein